MPKLVWKLAVSVAILAFILSRVHLGAVGRSIANADPGYLWLAFLFSLIMVWTDAALWKSVLQSLGHRMGIVPALLYSIVGCFFGSLAPSSVGDGSLPRGADAAPWNSS